MSEQKLTKGDVIKSWFRWFVFAQSNYNYERLQATAFAHAMLPIIKKLYKTKDEQKEAVMRHLSFFNTEPICGSVIPGLTVAMEEERANGKPITDQAFNGIKTGLMGPLAGIGDTLTQGVITPIMLAICIGITNNNNIAGPIIFVLAQFAIMTTISFSMWMNGYKYGRKAVEQIMSGGKINRVIDAASILGTLVMGGLVGRFIPLQFALNFDLGGGSTFSLQTDLLDKLFPGMIPLVLTLVVLKMVRAGVSPIKLMGILITFGAIMGVLGIF
jgi:PTS system mannose-specific IID component